MKCTKCGTEVPKGSAACKRCGAPTAGKTAAAAAAIPDEYDLMPLEPEKPAAEPQPPPAADPSVPPVTAQMARMKGVPTGSDGPPPLDPNYRPSRDSSPPESKLALYAGAAVGVLFLLFVGWRMFRTKNEMIVGKPKQEPVILLQPGATNIADFEVTGTIPYKMDVNVTEGEVQVAMVQRSPKSPKTLVELKKLPDAFDTLRKGDSKTFSGDFKHKEQWSWVFYNDSKKPARVKVKFSAG